MYHLKKENAALYDEAFEGLPNLTLPPRKSSVRSVFHNYVIMAKERNRLLKHLQQAGISAKVHYPIALHLQPASAYLGYKKGDFPVSEFQADHIISIPVHQHLTEEQKEYVIKAVKAFA